MYTVRSNEVKCHMNMRIHLIHEYIEDLAVYNKEISTALAEYSTLCVDANKYHFNNFLAYYMASFYISDFISLCFKSICIVLYFYICRVRIRLYGGAKP